MGSDYLSIAELENKQAQLQKQLDYIKSVTQANIKKAVVPIVQRNFAMAQQLILAEYKALAMSTFQEVFQDAYGKGNYVPQSINESLSYDINNLSPYLSYDVTKIIIKENFKQDARAFNQNANIEGSFGRNMDFEEIDAIEEANFYGTIFDMNDSPYEYAETINGYEEDEIQIFKGKRILKSPNDVCLDAKNQTQEK